MPAMRRNRARERRGSDTDVLARTAPHCFCFSCSCSRSRQRHGIEMSGGSCCCSRAQPACLPYLVLLLTLLCNLLLLLLSFCTAACLLGYGGQREL